MMFKKITPEDMESSISQNIYSCLLLHETVPTAQTTIQVRNGHFNMQSAVQPLTPAP